MNETLFEHLNDYFGCDNDFAKENHTLFECTNGSSKKYENLSDDDKKLKNEEYWETLRSKIISKGIESSKAAKIVYIFQVVSIPLQGEHVKLVSIHF